MWQVYSTTLMRVLLGPNVKGPHSFMLAEPQLQLGTQAPRPHKTMPSQATPRPEHTTTIATEVCACPCYESSVCAPLQQVAGFIPDKLHRVVFCCVVAAWITLQTDTEMPPYNLKGCVKSAVYMQQYPPVAVWHSLAACCCKQPVLSKGQVPLHKPRMPLQFNHTALPAA
jgi:hypothetical protein